MRDYFKFISTISTISILFLFSCANRDNEFGEYVDYINKNASDYEYAMLSCEYDNVLRVRTVFRSQNYCYLFLEDFFDNQDYGVSVVPTISFPEGETRGTKTIKINREISIFIEY
jgi:hypothetical protein